MRILVTGSAGHLGEALVRTLPDDGHEVIGLDILASPYTSVVGSIADRELVRRTLEGGGAVVNAAANPVGRHPEESHCIVGLTRAAAMDHVDRGVRVNAIVDGSPADFAAVAVWLCSDRAAHVTGAAIPAGVRPAPAVQPTQPGRTSPYS
jgi:NAD(P)-dependent dehydrogenase (short-subunit alcohol dehydrogenase family)